MSTLNVDKVDPNTGTDLELGTSGDTITVPTGAGLTVVDEVKTNKVSPASGTAFALGDSGDTFTVPSGATLDISASTLTPPATMPASSGVNLTALNATQLTSGKVPTAQLGTGTASSTTVLYGDKTYKAEPAGGLTEADKFNLTTAFTGTAIPMTANLDRMTRNEAGVPMGTGMTVSSGIFTFPSTGYWYVTFEAMFQLAYDAQSRYCGMHLQATLNDSTYVTLGFASANMSLSDAGNTDHTAFTSCIVDVTDVANCKVRFGVEPQNTATTTYASPDGFTCMQFIRLGDT
jgi:hypothetical protein